MNSFHVRIIDKENLLPEMTCNDFFHSIELFKAEALSPGNQPFMVIVENGEGHIVAHMLAIIHRHLLWFPPFFYKQGRVYGEGEYVSERDKDEVFALMLKAVTRKLKRRLCWSIEFRNTSHKMFGYRFFRQSDYFPINWQELYIPFQNSSPKEMVSMKFLKRILHTQDAGVVTREISGTEEIHPFYKLLKAYFLTKVYRFVPTEEFFHQLYPSENMRIFVTLYKDKMIGSSVCFFSNNNAYLWFLAAKRKTHMHLRPEIITTWHTISYAFERHCDRIYFPDVGIPFQKNPIRDFYMNFGGKPVTKYRWFKTTFTRINKIVAWCYRY